MTQTAEDVAIKVTIDGQQARTELDALGASAASAATAKGRLGTAIDNLGPATGQAAKGLSAMTIALGDTARAQSGLLRGMNDIIGLVGAGGAFGIAIAAGAAAVAALQRSWEEAGKKQEEVFQRTWSATERSSAALIKARAEVKDLQLQLSEKDLGPGARAHSAVGREMDAARTKIAEAEQALGALRTRERNLSAGMAAGARREAQEQIDAEYANIQVSIKQYGSLIGVLEKKQALARTLAMTDQKAKKKQVLTDAELAEVNRRVDLEKLRLQALKDNAEQLKKNAAASEAAAVAARKLAEEEHKQAEQRLKDLKESAEANAREVAQTMMQIASIGTGAIVGLVDGLITGQEKALERFVVNVMRQAGSSLISSGIQLVGAATVSALTGNLPGAAAQAAGAAGLISSGVALGGVATGIEHTAINGGQIGSAVNRPDRGSNSGSTRGGSSGGTVVYVSNYGVYGPSPEDSAREQTRMTRTARRRGIS